MKHPSLPGGLLPQLQVYPDFLRTYKNPTKSHFTGGLLEIPLFPKEEKRNFNCIAKIMDVRIAGCTVEIKNYKKLLFGVEAFMAKKIRYQEAW